MLFDCLQQALYSEYSVSGSSFKTSTFMVLKFGVWGIGNNMGDGGYRVIGIMEH